MKCSGRRLLWKKRKRIERGYLARKEDKGRMNWWVVTAKIKTNKEKRKSGAKR